MSLWYVQGRHMLIKTNLLLQVDAKAVFGPGYDPLQVVKDWLRWIALHADAGLYIVYIYIYLIIFSLI